MSTPVSLDQLALRAMAEGASAGGSAGAKADEAPQGKSFADTLTDLVKETDQLQKVSDDTVKGFVAGEVDDVHQVMVAMNRADLSFRMMLEVRNKLVEAYQEVMRLPV